MTTGKGIYLRALRNHGTPKSVAKYLLDAGFDAALLHINANKESDLLKYADEIYKNVSIGLYATPGAFRPSKYMATLDRMVELVEKIDYRILWMVSNPEVGWEKSQPSEARRLTFAVEEAANCCGRKPVIVTYPAHRFARVWASGLLIGSCEVYDRKNDQGPNFSKKWISRWKKYGYKEIQPSLAAWNKTPEQMYKYLRSQPPVERVWFWITKLPNGQVLDMIRRYEPLFPDRL